MTRHALLNNVTHKDLRVITRYGAEFGDDIGSVRTFPTEFAEMLAAWRAEGSMQGLEIRRRA